MKPSFSQRMGIDPIPDILQTNSMDQPLKTALWNSFYSNIWQQLPRDSVEDMLTYLDYLYAWGCTFYRLLVQDYFHKPIDRISYKYSDCLSEVREYFLSKASWSDVYNFVEFVCTCSFQDGYGYESLKEKFISNCNLELAKHRSGYRIVDGLVTPITNEVETGSIEKALESPYEHANQHLHSALEKLSDRNNPDYRNSIKESISAVETICRKLTGESTLDRALKKIDSKLHFNNQFKQGLEKLYHYTNGEDGIRHAIMEDSTISFDEAKFMLVSCSAFVNYLTAKDAALTE